MCAKPYSQQYSAPFRAESNRWETVMPHQHSSGWWQPHSETVGCIYASYPQYKSNILQNLFKSFKLSLKHSKLLKNIFLNFSVFLLTLVRVFYHFSVLHIVWRFVFCFRLEVWFRVKKHLLARWLNLTSWLSVNLGARVLGEQVYASETKLTYALSPQCLHSLRRWALTLL